MIQRLQSIFLFLAATMMSLLFVGPMPFVSIDKSLPVDHGAVALADGILSTQDHMGILVTVILAIVLPMLALFLYKNRPLQMRLGKISIAIVLIAIALTLIFGWQDAQQIPDDIQMSIDFGYIMPVLSIVFLVLALKYIKKDEKLVRSADRLR